LDFVRRGRVAQVAGLGLAAAVFGPMLVAGPVAASSYDPSNDVNSMANIVQRIGADDWWDAGFTGAGVDVALIDTGCTPVDGLDAPGKIVYGPDLSLESQSPNLASLDTNGHGTFMAGIIAGDASDYQGIAPDARIVCIKVGTADGGTDVSQV